MTDEAYEQLFKPVMRKVMEIYQPEAIVFQSGQPSLIQLTPQDMAARCEASSACTCRNTLSMPHSPTCLWCMCRRRLFGGRSAGRLQSVHEGTRLFAQDCFNCAASFRRTWFWDGRCEHSRGLMQGHAECQQFMMTFGLPMLVLGGGGYRINNVARCWAYETGRILGIALLLKPDSR